MKNKGYDKLFWECKRIFLFILIFGILVLSFISSVPQAKKIVLYFFYGQGCPHCAQMEPFLDSMQEKYPELEVKKFEVYFNNSNRDFFQKIASAYGTSVEGVPTVFIDGDVIVGYSDRTTEKLEDKIKFCIENGCVSPEDKLNNSSSGSYSAIKNSSWGIGVFFVSVFLLILLVVYSIKLNKSRRYRANNKFAEKKR